MRSPSASSIRFCTGCLLTDAISTWIWKCTMSRIATILHQSCRAATSQSLMGSSAEPYSSFDVLLRRFSCAEHSTKPSTSTLNQIKAVDQCSLVNGEAKISSVSISAHLDHNLWITSKFRHNALPGLSSVSSFRRAYSSNTRANPDGFQNTISNVSFTEASEVGTADTGGNTWIDMLDNARRSTIDAGTLAGKKLKELSDAITPHVQELFDTHPDIEKVVVPLGGTLFGTAMAWFIMPVVLRRLHKYAAGSPIMTLWGDSTKKNASYQTSLWSALEDPAKYIITFMAFSQMAAVIAPSISVYLPQAWRGAFVVSFVWFLHRWKTNFIANAMANQAAMGIDPDRLSAFDKVSSLGLIALGVIALAEACGVPVQSILTVGGAGGVATAFAARDILGNMLSGFSLQFSKPFSVGDYIKAGSIEGQVVDIGLTSTSLINTEKLPVVVPNSLFSSQMIVNKSRAHWRASMTKVPVRIEDLEKIPAVSEDIKVMLRSNPKIFLEGDAPYCYLSRLESSFAEFTIGCNLKSMRKEEWLSTEQDILLEAARIIKRHGLELGRAM